MATFGMIWPAVSGTIPAVRGSVNRRRKAPVWFQIAKKQSRRSPSQKATRFKIKSQALRSEVRFQEAVQLEIIG